MLDFRVVTHVTYVIIYVTGVTYMICYKYDPTHVLAHLSQRLLGELKGYALVCYVARRWRCCFHSEFQTFLTPLS